MESPKVRSTPTASPNGLANKPTIEAAQPEVDYSKSTARYANFCRLSGTPEELLIDFGLNSHPMANTPQEVMATQRVVAGWHTAKRLLHVLQQSVARHEAMFGVVEIDVQKRVRRA